MRWVCSAPLVRTNRTALPLRSDPVRSTLNNVMIYLPSGSASGVSSGATRSKWASQYGNTGNFYPQPCAMPPTVWLALVQPSATPFFYILPVVSPAICSTFSCGTQGNLHLSSLLQTPVSWHCLWSLLCFYPWPGPVPAHLPPIPSISRSSHHPHYIQHGRRSRSRSPHQQCPLGGRQG